MTCCYKLTRVFLPPYVIVIRAVIGLDNPRKTWIIKIFDQLAILYLNPLPRGDEGGTMGGLSNNRSSWVTWGMSGGCVGTRHLQMAQDPQRGHPSEGRFHPLGSMQVLKRNQKWHFKRNEWTCLKAVICEGASPLRWQDGGQPSWSRGECLDGTNGELCRHGYSKS